MNTPIHFERAERLMTVLQKIETLNLPNLRDIEQIAQSFDFRLIDCLTRDAPNQLVGKVSLTLAFTKDEYTENNLLKQLSPYEGARMLTQSIHSLERSTRALDLHYQAWLSEEYNQVEEACIEGVKIGHKALGYFFRGNLFHVIHRNEYFGQKELKLPRFYELHVLSKTMRDNYKGALNMGMEEARQSLADLDNGA